MRTPQAQRGFTLIEVVLAVGILAIVVFNVVAVMRAANEVAVQETSTDVLDDQAQTVLRRIALSLMAASQETLQPQNPASVDTSSLRYQAQLGIEDGEVVWDDPELIALSEEERQLFWSQNPDTADERRVVWTNAVAPFLAGELLNGIDDNGNGLIDEKGLSFQIDRNAVTIRLTMERRSRDGTVLETTVDTTVTCRNPTVNP